MCRVASSPIFFQVFPPSSDLYAPSPQEELCRLFGSPVPTHTTEGSDGAIAMSPIVDTLSLSNIGSHVVPLFVVFHTPPDAVPTYTMFGLLSTTAKSSMRPPMVAEFKILELIGGIWLVAGRRQRAHRQRAKNHRTSQNRPQSIPCMLHFHPPRSKARHITPAGSHSASNVLKEIG